MDKFFDTIRYLLGGALLAVMLTSVAISSQEDSSQACPRNAIEIGDLEKLQKILQADPRKIQTSNICRESLLHKAAIKGHLHIVQFLVENRHVTMGYCLTMGFFVPARDWFRRTPLCRAAIEGHLPVVQFLIREEPAWVNNLSTDYRTPLHYAAQKGYRDIAELLLDNRAYINAQDKNGATPLHWAAQEGHQPTIKVLVLHGADIDARDNKGMTPLDYAAWKGHRNVAMFLLKNGANIEAKIEDRRSPLAIALKYRNTDVVKELVCRYAFVGGFEEAITSISGNLL